MSKSFDFLSEAYPELFSFSFPPYSTYVSYGLSLDEGRGFPAKEFVLKSEQANRRVCGIHPDAPIKDNLHPLWKEYFSFYDNPESLIKAYSDTTDTPHELYALEAWYRMMLVGGANPRVLPPVPAGLMPNYDFNGIPLFGNTFMPYDRSNLNKVDGLSISFDSKLVLLSAIQENRLCEDEIVELSGLPSIFISQIVGSSNMISKIDDAVVFIFNTK
jgi:hypothetical protein